MDISNWPLERIMQLPDSCFGKRWNLGLGFTLTDQNPVYDIAEFAFPDVVVVWIVTCFSEGSVTGTNCIDLALGDRLPATDAEFDSLEKLFPGIISSDGRRGAFEVGSQSQMVYSCMRTLVMAQGRRLVGRTHRHVGASQGASMTMMISGIPEEIPDLYVGSPMSEWGELIRLMRLGAVTS